MRIQAAASGLFIGLLAAACGGKWTTGAGGTSSSGGAASAGATSSGGTSSSSGAAGTAGDGAAAGASCSTPSVCGGDVRGTWIVVSSCLRVSGQLDLTDLGVGCATAAVTGYRQVTGTWFANPDGTYEDQTTTTGEEQIKLAPACLRVSGTIVDCEKLGQLFVAFGYSSATCSGVPGGECACSGQIQRSGGLGMFSGDAITYGNFSASGNEVTLDGESRYSYCDSPSIMTWTPKTLYPTITGSIGFQRAAR